MKDKLLDIIKNNVKNYSKMIKNSPEMSAWVMENSLVQSEIFAEMIYSSINQISNVCENGKIKNFESFKTGYIGCGPASICACSREKVSNSVKKAKKLVTKEQQEAANKKRDITNIEKYGIACVAQLEENRQKFRDYYADPVKVAEVNEKLRNTYIEKYGVKNPAHVPEILAKRIATILTRYNVTNISQIPATKAKLAARMEEYKLNGHLLKKGYERFSKSIEEKYNIRLTTPQEEYLGSISKQVFSFTCLTCNDSFSQRFHYWRPPKCQICNPKVAHYTSGEEQDVYDYIVNELGITGGHQSDKSIINPFELDMVFPSHKIAIEYCGLYWHCEASSGKDKKYHAEKMKLTNQRGYRLITIFSDEWNFKKDIVKSKLKNIFGRTTVKHHARKLVVKELVQKESKEFLNKNHLQGHSTAKINLGLCTQAGQLVALMSFSNGRAALNTSVKASEYELVRFVTNGDSIVGGAGKLLKHFIKTYNPTRIISYADLRWSEGDLYKTLGFEERTKPTIGYWYVSDYEKREHRFNFTKKTLVKEGADIRLTEWEIMQELGYDRIWDCGHQKYIMEIPGQP
jgi:hypothetical protein